MTKGGMLGREWLNNLGVWGTQMRAVADGRSVPASLTPPPTYKNMNELDELVLALMAPEDVAHKTRILGLVLAKAPDGHAAAFLCASIANMVGNIPQDKWEKMLKFKFPPCPTPGCDCHHAQEQFLQALIPIRRIFEKAIEKRTGEKGSSA